MTAFEIFLIAVCVCLVLLPSRYDPAIWLKEKMIEWQDRNGGGPIG